MFQLSRTRLIGIIWYSFTEMSTLHRRHINAIASRVHYKLAGCSKTCWGKEASNKFIPITGPWWGGPIHQLRVDSPHKRSVIRKAFPYHDVIITYIHLYQSIIQMFRLIYLYCDKQQWYARLLHELFQCTTDTCIQKTSSPIPDVFIQYYTARLEAVFVSGYVHILCLH